MSGGHQVAIRRAAARSWTPWSTENGKFWNGLEQQLPSYLKSDDAQEGWFVALRYSSTTYSMTKVERLPGRVKALADELGKDIRFLTVDARRKKSASKLRPGDD